MSELLFPFVRWAQDDKSVFLKVDLRNVQDPHIKFENRRVEFQSLGEGAKGLNQYYFSVDLFGRLSQEDCTFKIGATSVDLILKKSINDSDPLDSVWWPRLTANSEKLAWLKIDFSKWQDPDISSSDDEMDRKRNMMNQDFDMGAYEKQQAEEMWKNMKFDMKDGRGFEPPFNLKKAYLILYNLTMFAGFSIILFQLTRGYMRDNTEYFPKTWLEVGGKMFCCQIAQFLEVGHVLVGYTKSSLPATFMQVSGRAFVLFVILNGEIRMQDKPFVFYLFYVWSMIEIIRYPYYFMSVLKKDVGILTWLRYTAWILLYPLGFLCEGIIIIRAMPLYEETEKFSYQMPNLWNVSFDFPSVLKLYLLFGFLPGIALLMTHMRQLRLKKLQKKKIA